MRRPLSNTWTRGEVRGSGFLHQAGGMLESRFAPVWASSQQYTWALTGSEQHRNTTPITNRSISPRHMVWDSTAFLTALARCIANSVPGRDIRHTLPSTRFTLRPPSPSHRAGTSACRFEEFRAKACCNSIFAATQQAGACAPERPAHHNGACLSRLTADPRESRAAIRDVGISSESSTTSSRLRPCHSPSSPDDHSTRSPARAGLPSGARSVRSARRPSRGRSTGSLG